MDKRTWKQYKYKTIRKRGGESWIREGFLMHAISDRKIIEKHIIKNAGYGIVEFEPYEAVYAK